MEARISLSDHYVGFMSNFLLVSLKHTLILFEFISQLLFARYSTQEHVNHNRFLRSLFLVLDNNKPILGIIFYGNA